MPATDTATMLLVDLPLCIGTTGSLARVLRDGRGGAGPSRWRRAQAAARAHRARRGPRAAPHEGGLRGARVDGRRVRPHARRRGRAKGATGPAPSFPTVEIALALLSFVERRRVARRPATGSRRRSRCSSRSATATSPRWSATEQAAAAARGRGGRVTSDPVGLQLSARRHRPPKSSPPESSLRGLLPRAPPEQVRNGLHPRGPSGARRLPHADVSLWTLERLRP